MRIFLRILRKINPGLHGQLLLAALAFIAMLVLSHGFMSATVHDSLIRSSNTTLKFTEARVLSELHHAKQVLERFSELIRRRTLSGDSTRMLRERIRRVSRYVRIKTHEDGVDFKRFCGYLESRRGKPVLICSDSHTVSTDDTPDKSPLYQRAVEANGDIVETVPFINSENETLLSYAKSVLDDKGKRLGIVRIDVQINAIGQDVVRTALNQGGYGMLLGQDLKILAHPNTDFVGSNASDPGIPFSMLADDFRNGYNVSEKAMISYKTEPSVAFFRRLPNGWYLGLVTPSAQYYRSMSSAQIILCLLGIALVTVSVVVLIRIDAARRRESLAHWYKSILDAMPLPISVTDKDMNWTFVNKAVETLLGKPSGKMIGKHCSDWNSSICNTDDCGIACVKRGIKQTFFDQNGSSYQVDIGILRNLSGNISGFVEVVQDITKIRNMTQQQAEMEKNISLLRTEASKIFYDPLTGIYNRRFFDEALKRLLQGLSRSGSSFALMMIDVDCFKQYNDTYGHPEGDKCLKAVAGTLNNSLTRTDDFAVRYGGEEFAVVLQNINKEGARLIADRLLENVRNRNIPHETSTVAKHITISVGIVTDIASHEQKPEDYVKRADEALYQSKRSGRNRYTFASENENPAASLADSR